MKITNINDEVLKMKRKDFKRLYEKADLQIDFALMLTEGMPKEANIEAEDLLKALAGSGLKLAPETNKENNLVRLAYFLLIGCVYKMWTANAS